jgi:hypothetical protein
MLAAALSQGKEPNEVSTFLEQRSQELKSWQRKKPRNVVNRKNT